MDRLLNGSQQQYETEWPRLNSTECWNCTVLEWEIDGGNGTWNGTTNWKDDILFTSLTSAILGVLILATIIGNVFVIAAILLERHLHSVANYLIVSLAVADLLVACLVMPLGAVYEISQKWILGPELCDMWTSSDVLCCTASILHLVAIATDRYWAVTNLDYIHNRNVGRIGTMIFLVWAVALVVSVAPLFGWKDADFLHRVNVQQRCLISQDVSYQIFATCATFYVPLTVILIVYWKIFQTARKRIRKRNNQQQHQMQVAGVTKAAAAPQRRWFHCSSAGETDETSKEEEPHTISPVHQTHPAVENGQQQDPEHQLQTTAFTIEVPSNVGSLNGSTAGGDQNCSTIALTSNSPVPPTGTVNTATQVNQAQIPKSNHQQTAETVKKKRETLEAKRERKAAKTLAIITGAFVVCWLPFFVCALLMPIFPNWVFDETMLSVFLWLGYFNSTLNPIIYTIFSPEFRQAFKRLLCGKSAVQTSAYRPRKLR